MTVVLIVIARVLAISLISGAVAATTAIGFFTAAVCLVGIILLLNTQQLVDILIEEHYG